MLLHPLSQFDRLTKLISSQNLFFEKYCQTLQVVLQSRLCAHCAAPYPPIKTLTCQVCYPFGITYFSKVFTNYVCCNLQPIVYLCELVSRVDVLNLLVAQTTRLCQVYWTCLLVELSTVRVHNGSRCQCIQ